MPASPSPATAPRAPIALVGALHVDELYWPIGPLAPRASNPVRRERRVGGVAANVARAALVAGTASTPVPDVAAGGGGHRPVLLCAALGDDADARWLVDTLLAFGIDCRGVTVPGRASGRYGVVHDEAGELLLGLSDVDVAEALEATAVRAALAGTDAAALVLDTNLSPACLGALLAREEVPPRAGSPATATAITASRRLDDAPRVALAVSPAKAVRLLPHLASLALLFCNRREAAALAGLAPDAPIGTLADALVAAGVSRLVLSDGGDPVQVRTPGTHRAVPVPPTRIRGSVNGAGDALAGATLAHWLDHDDLEAAVRESGLPAARAVLEATAGPPSAARRPIA